MGSHLRPIRSAVGMLVAVGLLMVGGSTDRTAVEPALPAGALTIVGLGDSVPAADTCGCRGYLEVTSAALHRAIRRPVVLHNDAVDGWTSGDVLDDVEGGRAADDLSSGADLVVIEAGANDLPLARIGSAQCQPATVAPCFDPIIDRVRRNLIATVQQVRRGDPVAGVRIVLVNYWNVGLDGSVGRSHGPVYVLASDAVSRRFNAMVMQVARKTGAGYLDTYAALKGSDGRRDPSNDLLSDGDHPNASGHRRLAAGLMTVLIRSGAVRAWSEAG